MSLSEASVKKLADLLFDPKRYSEAALIPTFGADTPYHDAILAAQGDVVKTREGLQKKYYSHFQDGEIPEGYKQKQDAIIDKAVAQTLDKHKQRFIDANANKFVEKLDVEEEIKGVGGWGLMGSLLGGGMGALMGVVHHLILSIAMKMEPVKQLLAQGQTWIGSRFSDDKKTWQEAGEIASFERKKAKMQQIGGSEESAAEMARVGEGDVESILASLKREEPATEQTVSAEIPENTQVTGAAVITQVHPQEGKTWEQLAASVPTGWFGFGGKEFVSAEEFSPLDLNRDGKLTSSEIPKSMKKGFEAMLAKQSNTQETSGAPTELNLGQLPRQGIPLAQFSISAAKTVG